MTAFGTGVRLGPRVAVQAQPQPWSPMDIGGLVLWVDPLDQRSVYLDSSKQWVVGAVNKVSGVTIPASINRPGYVLQGINGRASILFDPTVATRLQATAGSDPAVAASQANNGATTVFFVAQTYNTDYAGTVFSAGNTGFSSARTKRYGYNTGGTGQFACIAVDDAGASTNLVSTSGIVTGAPVVYSMTTDGATATILINGAEVGATSQTFAPSTLTPNSYGIGARIDSSPDSFMDGLVGEVLVFNRQLSAYEMLQVRAYLGLRWGVQAVQADEPLSIISSVASNFFLSADMGATGTLWPDQSGNARNFTQPNGSNFEPTVVPNSLNGKGTVLFDGVDDFYQSAYIPPAPGTTPSWYFIVFNPITAVTSATILGSNNTNRFRLYWANTTLLASYDGGTQLSGAVAANNWYRGALFFNNDVTDYRKIGSLLVTGVNAGNNTGSVGTYLGAISSAGAVPANVSIACVGSWAGQPTADEQAFLDLWVRAYYGASVQL